MSQMQTSRSHSTLQVELEGLLYQMVAAPALLWMILLGAPSEATLKFKEPGSPGWLPIMGWSSVSFEFVQNTNPLQRSGIFCFLLPNPGKSPLPHLPLTFPSDSLSDLFSSHLPHPSPITLTLPHPCTCSGHSSNAT